MLTALPGKDGFVGVVNRTLLVFLAAIGLVSSGLADDESALRHDGRVFEDSGLVLTENEDRGLKERLLERRALENARRAGSDIPEARVQRPENASSESAAERWPGLFAEYIKVIQTQILREWVRPDGITDDFSCTVKVVQLGGKVVRASIQEPCAADVVVQRSVIAAVRRADPLPYRGYEAVFSEELTFDFPPHDLD